MAGQLERAAGAKGEQALSPFAPAVYLLGIVLVLVPALDFTLNVWPLQPDEVGWRYGAVGLLAQYLHTPLLGVLIIGLFASVRAHRRTLLTLGTACALTTLLLLGALGGFSLDAIQLRAGVAPETLPVFHAAVLRAVGKLLTAAAAFTLFATAALRRARALRQTQRQGAAPVLRRAQRPARVASR